MVEAVENSIKDVTNKMLEGRVSFKYFAENIIEDCEYDYSIFPDCKTSYIWFSRGCIRNCPFCIVRKKEGLIHSVLSKNLNLVVKL